MNQLAWVLLGLAFAHSVAADERVAGRWEGTIQVPGRELRAVIDLAQQNGAWSGAVTMPDLNLKNAELAKIAVDGDDISFELRTALADPQRGPAGFKGRFDGGGKLGGDFTQGGNSAPFTLTKIGPPQIEPPRRSTAIAKELEGEWKGSYELFGYPRQVTIKLQNRGAEGATADFVIVGRKENKIPVTLVTQEGSFLVIDSPETGLTFEGQVEKEAIRGTVIQGPLEIPVLMQRAP